jgi:hypothetical protein
MTTYYLLPRHDCRRSAAPNRPPSAQSFRTALPPIGPIDDTLVNATIEAALTACGAVDRTADRPAAKPSQR